MKTLEMRLGEYRIIGSVNADGGIVVQASSSESNMIEAEMVLGPTATDPEFSAEAPRALAPEAAINAPGANRSGGIGPGPAE